MGIRKLLTRKAAEVVEAVAEPAKKAVTEQIESVKKSVGDRSDWGAKVAKFGMAILMLLITFREDRNETAVQERAPLLPGSIVINNYVNDTRERSNRENDPKSENHQES